MKDFTWIATDGNPLNKYSLQKTKLVLNFLMVCFLKLYQNGLFFILLVEVPINKCKTNVVIFNLDFTFKIAEDSKYHILFILIF